jgi:hypothetical protein
MWYPNEAQWWVIWIAAILISLVAFAGGSPILGIALPAVLLVWYLSRPKGLPNSFFRRAAYCADCGEKLKWDQAVCPICKSTKRRSTRLPVS